MTGKVKHIPTGTQYGFWTVVAPDGLRVLKSGDTIGMWLCKCKCGRYKSVQGANLRSGASLSCGCFRHRQKLIARGTRYGRLIIIKQVFPKQRIGKGRYYECVCDCGNIIETVASSLRTGNTQSCGCLKREHIVFQSQRNRKYPKGTNPHHVYRDTLCDAYVRANLCQLSGLHPTDIPQSLIELKRKHIQLGRIIKESENGT